MPEPRVGLRLGCPFGNGKTVVKGSFGLHRALLDTLDYRLDQTAPFNTTLSYSNTTVSKLPELSTSAATGGLVSPSNVQRNIETPTVLGMDAEGRAGDRSEHAHGVGYVGSHGYHQILSEDQNTPPSVVCPAASCPAVTAGWDGVLSDDQTCESEPRQLDFVGLTGHQQLQRARSRCTPPVRCTGFQLRGVYTWSKNLDDGSAWNTSVSVEHAGVCLVSRQSEGGLRCCCDQYQPGGGDQWDVGTAAGARPRPVQRCVVRRATHDQQDGASSGIATLQSGFPFSAATRLQPDGQR